MIFLLLEQHVFEVTQFCVRQCALFLRCNRPDAILDRVIVFLSAVSCAEFLLGPYLLRLFFLFVMYLFYYKHLYHT